MVWQMPCLKTSLLNKSRAKLLRDRFHRLTALLLTHLCSAVGLFESHQRLLELIDSLFQGVDLRWGPDCKTLHGVPFTMA
jgi:hypothetical protein